MIGMVEAVVLTVGMVGGYITLHRRLVNGPDEPWPGMTWQQWDAATPPF